MYYNPIIGDLHHLNKDYLKFLIILKIWKILEEILRYYYHQLDKKKKSLGDVPSRYMTGVLDFGTLEKKVQDQEQKMLIQWNIILKQ